MTAERAVALGLAGITALGLAIAAAARASGGRPTVLALGVVAALAIVAAGTVRHRVGAAMALAAVALLAAMVGVGEVVTPSPWGAIAEGAGLFLVAEATSWATERSVPMARPLRVEADRALAVGAVALLGAVIGGLVLADAAYAGALPRQVGLFVAGLATMVLGLTLAGLVITVDRPAPDRERAPAPPG